MAQITSHQGKGLSRLGRAVLALMLDGAIAVGLCAGLVGLEYYLPRSGAAAVPMPRLPALIGSKYKSGDFIPTDIRLDPMSWQAKFSDQFSDTVTASSDSYESPNLSIHVSTIHYDSGTVDENSPDAGTQITYHVADIYLKDISCLQTVFAKDRYDSSSLETPTHMTSRLGGVLSVNGDSYSTDQQEDNGIVVRNGTIYRCNPSSVESCVLNWDGTMVIYPPGGISPETLVETGAYQSWVFGPSLLDEDGKAKTEFLTTSYLRRSHPRTAIGYYEPGHYCLVAVDGRQPSSRGMLLPELAALFETLGCKVAYNLDGGHSSCMTLNGQIVNSLYDREYEVPDGIVILEGAA